MQPRLYPKLGQKSIICDLHLMNKVNNISRSFFMRISLGKILQSLRYKTFVNFLLI